MGVPSTLTISRNCATSCRSACSFSSRRCRQVGKVGAASSRLLFTTLGLLFTTLGLLFTTLGVLFTALGLLLRWGVGRALSFALVAMLYLPMGLLLVEL